MVKNLGGKTFPNITHTCHIDVRVYCQGDCFRIKGLQKNWGWIVVSTKVLDGFNDCREKEGFYYLPGFITAVPLLPSGLRAGIMGCYY